MKRVIAFTVVTVLAFAAFASAQSTTLPENRPLAEVAKDEEARRKSIRKPARIYTNGTLKPDNSTGMGSAPSVAGTGTASGNATPKNVTPGAAVVNLPGGKVEPAPAQDQAYWENRIKTARDLLSRTQLFADSLQTRINSLTTDFVNRDDPAQKAKIEMDRKAALAELERVKKELDEQAKSIKLIEDEARRAGVPPGWLRPGA